MKREDVYNVLFVLLVWGLTESRGSTQQAYRAKRYGSYYKSTYYSYSGVGTARYSRVYSRVRNLYASYYTYMFSWMNTDAYTVYKNTPSGLCLNDCANGNAISVCRNYEANDNGTFLGVFTCPLPYVPDDFHYCCGETNAEYCCKFWDVPLNVAAVSVGVMMGIGLFIITVYMIVQLCRQKIKTDAEKRERKAIRRIGMVRRGLSLAAVWASKGGGGGSFSEHNGPVDSPRNNDERRESRIKAIATFREQNGNS